MSDDKSTYTADELRSRVLLLLKNGLFISQEDHGTLRSMLNAGAKAIERVAVLEKALFVANGKANAAKRLIDKAEALGGTNFGKITTADILDYRRECEVLEARAVSDKPVAEPRSAREELVRDILIERQRQIDKEGYTPSHDAHHGWYELARAANAYLTGISLYWPWDEKSFKPKDVRSNFVKAGALLIASYEARAALGDKL
jgi:hypothetical protein